MPCLKVAVPLANGEEPPVTPATRVGTWLTVVVTLGEFSMTVVVPAWEGAVTPCSRALDVVEPTKFVFPPYVAVMGCVAALSVLVVSVAPMPGPGVRLPTAPVPMDVPLS